jgi:hypothetical protein
MTSGVAVSVTSPAFRAQLREENRLSDGG